MKNTLKIFFVSLAGTLAAVALLALFAGSVAWVKSWKPKIEDRSYLVIELHGDLPEYDPPGGVLSQIAGGDTETLTRVLSNLEKARVDDRIAGVILKVAGSSEAGLASSEEIRAALKRLREAGKNAYGWAESFAAADYSLLAACDEIFAPPSAYVQLTGFALTTSHVKLALDKLGIRPDLHKIKDYKSAAELVTRADMSEPARENRRWLMDERWQSFTEILAADRGIDGENLEELMRHAAFTADEALEAGLVDRLLYWEEVEALLEEEKDDELRTVSQARYAQVPPKKLGLKGDKTVAVIHAQGTITGRESGISPLFGVTMGHETIVRELRRARKDNDVAAVVFRVDSRGGESLASDLMSHEVEITAAVKPVVASMVDVAASGGYAIAYRASRVLANPTTITGSIGSISGKFNLAGFYDKLGITQDQVTRGPMAQMYSDRRDFTPEERARFEENHWQSFNRWLNDVADHRGMSFEEAELLAHGRVWSGRQAVANGLVDELGDLDRAVQVAKELAGIPADEGVTVVHYPLKKGLLQSLLGDERDAVAAARWAVWRLLRQEIAATWKSLEHEPGLAAAALGP